MKSITKEINGCKYLSEVYKELPSGYLINKGITGCGGTTVELLAKRNSIILCPTKNLVTSKTKDGYLGVTGDTTNPQIKNYLKSNISYKKILATYDALERLMQIIDNYEEYFLLIDEYHLLFNDYSFRDEAILYVLNNFRKFNRWAFLTATPLKEEFILKELRDIDQLNLEWVNSKLVDIKIKDTYFIQKELINLIELYKDRNLHIFLNSISTINTIADKLNLTDYRIVCSEHSKLKPKNFAKINSKVRKINFYTSCAFEGCDIYDPDGYCIIVCDTHVATTILDISTKVRQVCGRLRDSKYKDKVTLILNTSKHRYAGTTKQEFMNNVDKSIFKGNNWCKIYREASAIDKDTLDASYNKDTFATFYVRKYNNTYYYDENLKSMDVYNYNLISEIYNSTISVFTECINNNMIPSIEKSKSVKGLTWVIQKLQELNKLEYTYEQLENIFKPLFIEHNLKWSKNTSIKNFFPTCTKKQKMIKGTRSTFYKFDI